MRGIAPLPWSVSRWRDNAPQIYYDEARREWVFGCQGIPAISAVALFAAGKSAEELPGALKASLREVRPGGWDPAERLKDVASMASPPMSSTPAWHFIS